MSRRYYYTTLAPRLSLPSVMEQIPSSQHSDVICVTITTLNPTQTETTAVKLVHWYVMCFSQRSRKASCPDELMLSQPLSQ